MSALRRTHRSAALKMRRLWQATALLALTGCATIVPMQTASVVDEGAWRIGGQASAAAFCNLADVTKCHDYPDGIQTPEVRANVRRGVGLRADLGASLQLQPVLFSPERPLQVGLTLDLKREWLRVERSGLTHVLSAGLLGAIAISGRANLAPWFQAEVGVPVFYGLQTHSWEVVFGISAADRTVFSPGPTPRTDKLRIGASLGLFRRAPGHWAAQLTYLTDARALSAGSLALQFALFWDVVPAPKPGEAEAVSNH